MARSNKSFSNGRDDRCSNAECGTGETKNNSGFSFLPFRTLRSEVCLEG